jgi:hypothetical protein
MSIAPGILYKYYAPCPDSTRRIVPTLERAPQAIPTDTKNSAYRQYPLQWHLDREENSLENSPESSLEGKRTSCHSHLDLTC